MRENSRIWIRRAGLAVPMFGLGLFVGRYIAPEHVRYVPVDPNFVPPPTVPPKDLGERLEEGWNAVGQPVVDAAEDGWDYLNEWEGFDGIDMATMFALGAATVAAIMFRKQIGRMGMGAINGARRLVTKKKS